MHGASGVSRNFVEDRRQREWVSGVGSCNLVQENFISYSKIFLIFGTLRIFMMTTNLFVIANVKQLRTGGSFRILLHFFQTSWCVGILNSRVFNSFHIWVEFGTILEGLRNFGGGEGEHPKPPLGTPHGALLAALHTLHC